MAKQSTAVLKLLQDKAMKEVEIAQEALALAIKSVDEAKHKGTLLADYRQGYSDDLTRSLDNGLKIESYKNTQNFLMKLDDAVVTQKDVVKMAEAEVTIKRQALQSCQKKKLSYDVLIDRADKRVLRAELKSDQKMMDEFAMRASRSKR